MPVEQFELQFSLNKHKLDGRQAVKYTFDELNGVGVTVIGHQGRDDEEGERVDMEPRGDNVCAYKVPVDDTICVRLSRRPDAAAMLLTPVLVLADGVEERFPDFELNAKDLYQLPQNIEMDPGEGPNFWILKEHDEVVLTLMIYAEN